MEVRSQNLKVLDGIQMTDDQIDMNVEIKFDSLSLRPMRKTSRPLRLKAGL